MKCMFHLSFKQASALIIAIVVLTTGYRTTSIVRERGDMEEAMQKLIIVYIDAVEKPLASLASSVPSSELTQIQEKLRTLQATSDFSSQHKLLSAFQADITKYIVSIPASDGVRLREEYSTIAREIVRGGEPSKQLLVYNTAAKVYNADLETSIGSFIGKFLDYTPAFFLQVDGTMEEKTIIYL